MISISLNDAHNFSLGHTVNAFQHQQERNEARCDTNSHYRFLAYISTKVNGKIILDIGTRRGSSAISLAHNKNNAIVTFDIKVYITKINAPNIIQVIANPIDNKYIDILLKSKIIFLDTDPHDGKQELTLYNILIENNYTGILLMHDVGNIKAYPNLHAVWNDIPMTKYLLTDFDIGIIDFNSNISSIN